MLEGMVLMLDVGKMRNGGDFGGRANAASHASLSIPLHFMHDEHGDGDDRHDHHLHDNHHLNLQQALSSAVSSAPASASTLASLIK